MWRGIQGTASAKSWGRSDRLGVSRGLSKCQTGRRGMGVASVASGEQDTFLPGLLVPLAAEGPWAGCYGLLASVLSVK